MAKCKRRSVRVPGYDYTSPGGYFVTVAAYQREKIFGEVENDQMRLNPRGEIVSDCWQAIPRHFSHVELGAFVIMPNHVHGIIVIKDNPVVVAQHEPPNVVVGATHASPLRQRNKSGPVPGSLGAIIGSFKSAATKGINGKYDSPGMPLWQRNYYEHIIRDDRDWQRIHDYIIVNPANWADDEENQPRE